LNTGDIPDQPHAGLDIIKYLVSKLDGTLTVESTPGVGSAIDINLTFSKVEEPSLIPDTTSI